MKRISQTTGLEPDAANSRGAAARIVARWMQTGEFPNRMLESVSANRPFVMEVVYGVVRWRRLLDWVIADHVRRRPAPELAALLYVGLYQVLIMEDVAHYAAVNETVAAAKAGFATRQADFVNALLRQVLREKTGILQKVPALPLGIRESHPDCLIKRWTKNFGAAATQRLCAWNNTRPETVIRINRLKTDCVRYRSGLLAAGIRARAGVAPDCIVIPHGLRVEDLPGYAGGDFIVVDPSVLKAVEMLDPQPGDKTLDACAAPGGKTVLIAERMRRRGQLVALEMHADRLARLRENLRRTGCADFVEVVHGNAMNLTGAIGAFDRILLDVPCTNTGVIRRKPDIRWRFTDGRLARTTRVQRAILERAVDLLNRGGTIVYSTCSLEPEENGQLIADWLGAHPEFQLAGEWASFPPEAGMDGAYVAAIKRR